MSKKYFARANTAYGLINMTNANLDGISKAYILKGCSKSAKTMLIKIINEHFELNSVQTELLVCPFNITQYDGVIIPSLNAAVIDGDCIQKVPHATFIDTDKFLKFKKLEITPDYKKDLLKKAENSLSELYASYRMAKSIHDEWEKIYIQNMDFERLNSYTSGVLEKLITTKNNQNSHTVYERFFGASTPDGSVNYIDNLTDGLEKRYFIKGRPGTGKSTFLKKLAKKAAEYGYTAEIYYCSFDKNSLDMVIVPELSFCVFDSTAPHEMYPSEDRDFILDFYTQASLTGTDEHFSKQLEFVNNKYRFRISEGSANLRKASIYLSELEFYYSRITDTDALSKTADKIVRKL